MDFRRLWPAEPERVKGLEIDHPRPPRAGVPVAAQRLTGFYHPFRNLAAEVGAARSLAPRHRPGAIGCQTTTEKAPIWTARAPETGPWQAS